MIEDEKTKMGTGSPVSEMPVMPKGSSADKLGLEEIVYLSNKIGLNMPMLASGLIGWS